MRSIGFDAAPISAEIERLEMDDWRARTAAGKQLRATRMIRARAPHDSQDLLRALESTRPDTIIVDVLASGALNAAASWGGPWSCYRPFPLPPFSRIGLGLLDIHKALSAAPLHLYMTAPPFGHRRRGPSARVLMVGPCGWEPAGEMPSLHEVEGPLLLITGSTEFQDDRRLTEVGLEALASEPVHVVATLPSARTTGLKAPPNATVVPFAPHTGILERAPRRVAPAAS